LWPPGPALATTKASVWPWMLYAKYAGTEFKIDGKKLLILKESDLLAVIEPDEVVKASKKK
jgi:co-chaperonin GroES (HSP10)